MYKYKTVRYKAAIEKVEIIRESKQCVWIYWGNGLKEYRQNKLSSYEIYHDSWQLAYDYLLDRSERDVRSAKDRLKRAKETLEKTKVLTKK